jgi:hypothetical protein
MYNMPSISPVVRVIKTSAVSFLSQNLNLTGSLGLARQMLVLAAKPFVDPTAAPHFDLLVIALLSVRETIGRCTTGIALHSEPEQEETQRQV